MRNNQTLQKNVQKNVRHLCAAGSTNHLHGHWRYLQQNCDIFLITLMRGVTEKETVFTLSSDSSPTDHYIKLQNYLPAGRTELFISFYVSPCPLSKVFSLFYPIFEWEWTSPNSPFSCPAFQDLLLYLEPHTFRKASIEGRFCSWSSSSSLKNFWQCLFFFFFFLGKRASFVDSYLNPIHTFDPQKV